MEMHDFKTDHLKAALPRIAEQHLSTGVTELKFIGGGSYGRVFKVKLSDGRVAVLKAYRRKGMQESEASQLKILAEHTCVPMPQVLFTHSDNEVSVLAMTLIEGKNVLDPRFLLKSKAQKEAFAKDVIRGMLDWHKVKGKLYGDLQMPIYADWYNYYRTEKVEPVISFLKEKVSNGEFSVKEYDLICKGTEAYDKLGDEPEEPVLIHGDLNIMNIMADPKTLKLTGFIDPCGSMWANREYDLFQLRNMWGDCYGLFETYKKNCKLSPNSDFRIAYYGAINEIKCFIESGEDFALWRNLWNNMLKKELNKL